MESKGGEEAGAGEEDGRCIEIGKHQHWIWECPLILERVGLHSGVFQGCNTGCDVLSLVEEGLLCTARHCSTPALPQASLLALWHVTCAQRAFKQVQGDASVLA